MRTVRRQRISVLRQYCGAIQIASPAEEPKGGSRGGVDASNSRGSSYSQLRHVAAHSVLPAPAVTYWAERTVLRIDQRSERGLFASAQHQPFQRSGQLIKYHP